jgi:hypothetical protein
LRLEKAQRTDIRAALWEEHSLVKTYGPRGTVHLLAAQDLPLWSGALSATSAGQDPKITNKLLASEQAEAVIEAIALILEDAELTVDELTEALVERLGPWAGEPVMPAFTEMWPRWRAVQGTAAVRGRMCFAPNRGRKVTYTNPRRWLPGFQPAGEKTALSWLVRSYLYAYGPATPQQFAQWLAMPGTWANSLFASLSSQLEQVEVEGNLAWVAAGDIHTAPNPPQSVRLLPYFDAYIVGCHPRERLYPGEAATRAIPSGQAGVLPVLLIDGRVAGVWNQRRSGRTIGITVEAFGELSAAQRGEIDIQVQRIGEILEGNFHWRTGTVTTGAHA